MLADALKAFFCNMSQWLASPMMRAVQNLETSRVPVWMMRQAGRYMSEYNAVREKYTFLELCKTPELAAEIMLTAVNKLGVDAAIIFSDILLLLEPLGLKLTFLPEGGPKILNPIQTAEDAAALPMLESAEQLDCVMQTVRLTRQGLDEIVPLIGFCGAPFTLAAYAVEGGTSRDFAKVKTFMRTCPLEWIALMKKLALSAATYLNGQILSGVQIVQIFDSWAGCLSVDDYYRFVQPYSKLLIENITPGTPVIHFAPGNPMLLPNVRDAGGNCIGVDWRIPLDKAREILGFDKAVQGNLDPSILLANRNVIRLFVKKILLQNAGKPGFVFNLGHGIMKETPVENAVAFVEAVHEFG
jgi:uroporphyrinogen decarboxylase